MHAIKDGKVALAFLMGGGATITLRSTKTLQRFTYSVRAPRNQGKLDTEAPIRFVKVLTGPDNTSNYEYIGYIRDGKFNYGMKSRISNGSPSIVAFQWAYRFISIEHIPKDLDVFHEGKCGRCGRKLTTPESIQSGFGEKCLGALGV